LVIFLIKGDKMLNKLIIQGKILKEIELKTSENGTDYVIFTLVWSEKYGEKQQSCFLKCMAYRHNATFLEKFFDKGDIILAEGKLTTEKYEDHGQEKWVTQLLVDKLHFPGIKKAQANNEEKDDEDEEVLPF
jgi:single-strand DNA-binding protein